MLTIFVPNIAEKRRTTSSTSCPLPRNPHGECTHPQWRSDSSRSLPAARGALPINFSEGWVPPDFNVFPLAAADAAIAVDRCGASLIFALPWRIRFGNRDGFRHTQDSQFPGRRHRHPLQLLLTFRTMKITSIKPLLVFQNGLAVQKHKSFAETMTSKNFRRTR